MNNSLEVTLINKNSEQQAKIMDVFNENSDVTIKIDCYNPVFTYLLQSNTKLGQSNQAILKDFKVVRLENNSGISDKESLKTYILNFIPLGVMGKEYDLYVDLLTSKIDSE
jgi:hypothetical protein